jgi:hypothetical protein
METEVKEELSMVLQCGKIALDGLQSHGDKARLELLENIVRDLGAIPAYVYCNFNGSVDDRIAGDMMLSAMIYIEYLQNKEKTSDELINMSRVKSRVQLKGQSKWIKIIIWSFLIQQLLYMLVNICRFKLAVFPIIDLAVSSICVWVCIWALYKTRRK